MPTHNLLTPIQAPELVIGLVGPIGADLEKSQVRIRNKLKSFDYDCVDVKITDELRNSFPDITIDQSSYLMKYNELISACNKIRQDTRIFEMMAILAVSAIRREREEIRKRR